MKLERLTCQQDFRTVYKKGRLTFGRYVAVHVLVKDDGPTRIGISVSKKVGNAVVRNLVKRRIREIIRHMSDMLPNSYDIVIGAKVRSREANYHQLAEDLMRILKDLKMVK